jgi:uncharacterized protein (TIGR02145 family)
MFKNALLLLLIFIVQFTSANVLTVKIGNNEWTTENLAVTKFRNGEEIPQAKNMQEWQDATENYKPVWCYPDFKESNAGYGLIYNYYAISTERKICPEGFHIPTPAEWRFLVESVNTKGKLDAGRKLKGKTGWKTDASAESVFKNGTDEFGFNAGPGGYIRYFAGAKYENRTYTFTNIDESVAYWSNSINGYNVALGDFSAFILTKNYSYVQMHDRAFREGYFVRCVKNDADFKENAYFPNKRFTYHYWMTENLGVKNFRNGEEIPYAKNKKEWEKLAKSKTAACCSVDFDSDNDKEFGLLYNWYAVVDSRGLAPEGWKIPSYSDWYNLVYPVKDKYTKMENWASDKTWKNHKGTNETGFNGKAAGILKSDGKMEDPYLQGKWWHSDESNSDSESAYSTLLNLHGIFANSYTSLKASGLSVRCIK